MDDAMIPAMESFLVGEGGQADWTRFSTEFKVKKKPSERYFRFTQTEGEWTIALRDDHEQIAPGPPATKYRRVEVDVPMTVPDATEHLMSERRVVR